MESLTPTMYSIQVAMIVDSLKFKGKGGLRDIVTVKLWINGEERYHSVDQRHTVKNANLGSLPGQRH